MLRRTSLVALAVAGTLVPAGCARPAGLFSEQNARAHVSMLAGTIGSRAIGTPANERARQYVISQLTLFGFEVRVQEADARRPELGRTARVANVIATLPGARAEAIGLVAHYDSHADTPGASDDALGVAVAIEAARVFAARSDRQWSLMVLLTDGEEAGLMGAAALVTDREVTERLATYLQVESIGSEGPALLFETGPANGWLVGAWARSAPHPRGASFAVEIYERLPNDTDFSIIERHGIPGLNFAPVADSYAYHTARDTPERLSARTVRETGENVVSILNTLNGMDITHRSTAPATFFDVGGAAAVSYGPLAGSMLSIASLLCGVIAWVRLTATAVRTSGLLRWLLTCLWSGAGAVLVFAAMAIATSALRAASHVYHPWYARPGRLFLLLVASGTLAGWAASRAGRLLPERAHPLRHPLVVWSITLPVWIALAVAARFAAPAAGYLWSVPLVAAAAPLMFASLSSVVFVRTVSLLAFALVATLWLPNTILLLHFLVAMLGRLPVVTPVFVYAAVISLAAVMLVPPLVGAFAGTRRLRRPSLITSVALIAVAATAGAAYQAPAYTADAPLRRSVRVLQAPDGPAAWEVGSTEPGLDLGPGGPADWMPQSTTDSSAAARGPLPHPFVFTASGPPLGAPPAAVTRATLEPVTGGLELVVSVVPHEPGLTASFVLPPGVTPVRHNLPGTARSGVWTATYVAIPKEGVLFRASFPTQEPREVGTPRVFVSSSRLPGGEGWQSLPTWLPQERTVWSAGATWLLPIALPEPRPRDAGVVAGVALR
jgi:hypothetical protein